MNKCPNCGKNMEQGYVGSESLISGMKWFMKKKALGLGGELILKPDATGMVYVDAFRCKKCKTVVFSY